MKVYIYLEEWIAPWNYESEAPTSAQTDVCETFEKAEAEWADRRNRRNMQTGVQIEPAPNKTDKNADGWFTRYYIVNRNNTQSLIKTTIYAKAVL